MKNRKYYLVALLLTALVAMADVWAYPRLPETIVTHWNLHNVANGWSPKWVLFLVGPGLMLALMLLMRVLPWLSPKNFEVASFQVTYLQIMVMLVCVAAYLQLLVLWSGLGHAMNIGRATVGGVCLLFALLGNLMGKVRRNFFVGVRTPWTLANERVWNATHRFAAKTMVVGGLAGLVMTAAGVEGWPVLGVLLAGALAPVVYSLVMYKQMEAGGEL
ncbi:MAG: SdpI family protein [Candidatus Acidiferrum sp.]|jgi:uncharacterized membrane protein